MQKTVKQFVKKEGGEKVVQKGDRHFFPTRVLLL